MFSVQFDIEVDDVEVAKQLHKMMLDFVLRDAQFKLGYDFEDHMRSAVFERKDVE